MLPVGVGNKSDGRWSFASDSAASPLAASAVLGCGGGLEADLLPAQPEVVPSCISLLLQILETCQRESVRALRRSQNGRFTSDHTVLCSVAYQVQFATKDDRDFLGSHKLYYCKCSCVYILEKKDLQ